MNGCFSQHDLPVIAGQCCFFVDALWLAHVFPAKKGKSKTLNANAYCYATLDKSRDKLRSLRLNNAVRDRWIILPNLDRTSYAYFL